MSEQKDDSFKVFGAAVVVACGVYELALATGPSGHGWQFLAGIAFVTFGLVRGWYLFRSAKP